MSSPRRATCLTLALGALVAGGCDYDYVIPETDASASSSSTTASGSTSTSATTDTSAGTGGDGGGTPASGGGGEPAQGGGGSGDGGAAGTGGTGGTGGGDGGGGEGGEGGGQPCDAPDDCQLDPEDVCRVALCEDGRCAYEDAPFGTPIGEQAAGDCVLQGCDGGILKAIAADDPPAATDCATFTCSEGRVVPDYAEPETECGNGLVCDDAGSCVGCVEAANCPTAAPCRVAVCGDGGICAEPPGTDGDYDGLAANDCKRRICSGGQLITTAQPGDPPASDGLPCTDEVCVGQDGMSVAVGEGLTAAGCNGVCQGGAHATQCGLSVYIRQFPGGPGGWTRLAITSAWGSGTDVPDPTGVQAADLTSAGRLMVWSSDGFSYEYRGGSWQPRVATTTRFSSITDASFVAAALSGDYNLGDDILVISTNQSPPQCHNYDVPDAGGAPVFSSVATCTDESAKPNAPPQHTTTMTWAFSQQDGAYPALLAWKSLVGIVYQQDQADFSYPAAPVAEASSPFALNGTLGAPAAGTSVAAYYDADADRVYFVAP